MRDTRISRWQASPCLESTSCGQLASPTVEDESGVGSARPRQHRGWEAPATKATGFCKPSTKKKELGRVYKDPLPALPLSLCAGVFGPEAGETTAAPPAAQVDPTALATPEENSENGAYVYHVVPEAFRRELAKGFHAAIVAKALREHGHLNGELGRLAYLERLPGLGHQRVYHIQSSILAE